MKALRVVEVVGARPQFVKLASLSRAFAAEARGRVEEIIVHTGQHYDPELSDVFFDELEIPRASVNLEVGSGPHGRQTGAMLERLEAYLVERRPDAVVVFGDTNSTVAGALAAAKLGIPLAHVEAGLRSFNRVMPEEHNRVIADHLSDLLLAPTDAAVRNLRNEGLQERTRLVGDVMYDAVLVNADLARKRSGVLERLRLDSRRYGIVTLHRAENTAAAAIGPMLRILAGIAEAVIPLAFPLHPRTREVIRAHAPEWRPPAGLLLCAPLGPLDMLRLTESAAVVITDSGGLQKEAFMLGRPCITLRSETEWIETVAAGANVLVGGEFEAAVAAARRAVDNPLLPEPNSWRAHELYGQGQASMRCAEKVLALAQSGRG
ncbi:MAG: non-hydrolyzing UDP-N-acetylglucosamine 2-epimerase [Steroidobacteraceae bacterium]